ncbi:hypothetical protein LZ653_21815 [Hafnia paralvei]|nr:hypothetical protein [Hafnia paralvei]MCE9909980.1 hypothetical protein [Hafnia paralvei]MCE9913457.1 hypothetical protein [Hafnia paralvei]
MTFNAEMVRAILSGRKTQTRRIVKNQREGDCWSVKPAEVQLCARHTHDWWLPTGTKPYSSLPACPHGNVEDRIWVRETWAEAGGNAPELQLYRASYPDHVPSRYENLKSLEEIRWTPSIHMPRWASRILLEITNVRVERLNDISEEDAIAEGIDTDWLAESQDNYDCIADHNMTGRPTAKGHFSYLWQSIYGDDKSKCWEKNPWVWVIEFKRVQEQSNDQ